MRQNSNIHRVVEAGSKVPTNYCPVEERRNFRRAQREREAYKAAPAATNANGKSIADIDHSADDDSDDDSDDPGF